MVSDQAADQAPDRNLVFINLPIFFTSTPEHPQGCPDAYPFVGNGAGAFLDYADVRDFIRVNKGIQREARAMTVADYPPAWPPRHGTPLALDQVHKLLIDNQVYVFDPSTWTLEESVCQLAAISSTGATSSGDVRWRHNAETRGGPP